ncbi:hypothetical protein M3194_24770 [Paenibacillus glycanilyticus]|uniref:hypothetical protein n=1 Tax=Paenibacillus glycanilyticus TaxID=126569 RepID=UPI0020407485|nr:hypothetical protein [Paenibacillus glycanilyticus]MCM3630550.1 hypothetical protein [Paenibacillus glycanilyticus]
MKKNIVALGAIISAAVPVLHWLFLEWWSIADSNEGNDQEAAVFGFALDDGEGSGEATLFWYDFGLVAFLFEFVICFLCFTGISIIISKYRGRKKTNGETSL